MAMGLKTNFVINNPFIYTGYTEMLTQFSAAFNEQSGGCITLTSASKRGELEEKTFFQNINGLVRERDPSSDADVADKNMDMETHKQIRLERGIGPVAQSYDSFRKIGMGGTVPDTQKGATGIDAMDMVVGQQTAKGVQVEMVNTAIACLVTSLRQLTGAGGLVHQSLAADIESTDLVDGLALMGDAASNNVRLWVMHSYHYYKLIKQQITANLDSTTGFVLASASPVTLNRPVLVIDSPSLIITDGAGVGVNSYVTLGLGANAVEVEDGEDMMLASQLITGKQNLGIRLQGEYSYQVGVRGFSYDVTAGGVNPNTAALKTAANWDKVFADVKDLGGVVIETK